MWTFAGPLVWSLEERWPLAGPAEAGPYMRAVGLRRRDALVRHMLAAFCVACVVLVLTLISYHSVVRIPMLAGWFAGLDRSIRNTAVLYSATYFHVELVVYAAIVAAAHAVQIGRAHV